MDKLRETYDLFQKHCPLFIEDDPQWIRKMHREIWQQFAPQFNEIAKTGVAS